MKTREQYNTYMRKYMLRRYHERRRYAIKKLGGKCVKCGSKRRLEFHHKDKKTKSINLGTRLHTISWELFVEELKKCELLCNRHHTDATLKEKGQRRAKGTHGTLSSYRYCRCSRCRAAHSAYMKEYRSRRAGV